MKKILWFALAFALAAWAQSSAPAHIDGRWQLSMDTPHGVVKGPFTVRQDGAKAAITYQTELFGTASGTGAVDGNKVSFTLSVKDGPEAFGFSGTVNGSKMSGRTEMDGEWSATREGAAAAAAARAILGTVTDFRVKALELGVKADDGGTAWVKFDADTEVLLAAPGEKDLSHAQPAKIADVARGDRVLVSYVDGMTEARRIVVVAASEIARRNAAERLDWEKRGMTGVVAARDGDDIMVEARDPNGVQRTTLVVNAKTKVRRYAPDSVKFVDARPAPLDEIAVGDQVRARGDRTGDRVEASDVVFGTFLTTLGTVAEVDRARNEVRLVDMATKQPLVVRLTADTQMKKLPDMQDGMAEHGGGHPSGSLAQMLQQLPAGTIDDLKPGSSVMVTSTRGSHPGKVTGIMVIANVDPLIEMAQSQAAGASPMEALNRLHGGMMSGPGGFSLPAILQ